MKEYMQFIGEKVLDGAELSFEEAVKLGEVPSKDCEEMNLLLYYANEVRKKYVGNKASLCSIMNVKSGRCSEDCKYCAQSSHYKTGVEEYDLLSYDQIHALAQQNERKGVHRFSLVSSGRGLDDKELNKYINIYEKLTNDRQISICASHGFITYEQALELKKAGVKGYHHNIEITKDKYETICTTHTYEERVETIKNAKKAGLSVCCGGILGLGETFEDRIKMIFEIKEIGADSVPLNVLNPVQNTPLEENEVVGDWEILKTFAIYRLVYKEAEIRYAGGRKAILGKSKIGFLGGVNGALTGDFLTTTGTDIEQDKNMLIEIGYEL